MEDIQKPQLNSPQNAPKKKKYKKQKNKTFLQTTLYF